MILSLPTYPNPAALLNIAEYLIRSTPSKVQEIRSFVKMIPKEKSSWDIRLSVAKILLDKGKTDQAQELITCINAGEYLEQAENVGQVNRLLNVLMHVGKSDEALYLLSSARKFESFSDFEVTRFRLNLANLLLMQNKTEKAKSLISELNFSEIVKDANSADQFSVLCNVLTSLNKSDVIIDLFKSGKIFRFFEEDSTKKIIINTVIKFTLQGWKDSAIHILSNIDIDAFLSSLSVGLLAHSYTLLGMFEAAADAFEIGERKQLICDDFFTFKSILYRCIWEIDKSIENIQCQIKKMPTERSLFWNAFLMKTCGQNSRSRDAFQQMLNMPLDPNMKSAVLTEIGNVYRSDFQYIEAMHYYDMAKQKTQGTANWRPYFEQALLFLYAKKYKNAQKTLNQGIADGNRVENACQALQLIINCRNKKNSVNKDEISALISTSRALSSKPYFPYAAYIDLIHANIIFAADDHKRAIKIMKQNICDKQIIQPSKKNALLFYLNKNRSVEIGELHRLLSQGIWPFHNNNSFEHSIFKMFVLNTDILLKISFN